MSILSDTRPIARKPHRCCACETTIPAGERYTHQKGVDDDGWWTWVAHLACHDAWSTFQIECAWSDLTRDCYLDWLGEQAEPMPAYVADAVRLVGVGR